MSFYLGLSAGNLVLVHADALEVLDEFGGHSDLEFLGIELDAVLGAGVVEEEGERNGALMLLDHLYQVQRS